MEPCELVVVIPVVVEDEDREGTGMIDELDTRSMDNGNNCGYRIAGQHT